MTSQLRRATVADAPEIARLEGLAAYHPWSEGEITSSLSAPTTVAWLLLHDAAPAGYLIATEVAGTGELYTIGVDPTLRRQGFANLLMGALLAHWRAFGVVEGYLEVREGNTAAIALYNRHGFRQLATRPNYYGPGENAQVFAWSPR